MASRVSAAVLSALDTFNDDQFGGVDAVSLHTDDPGADGTSDELDSDLAPGYSRQTMAFAASADGIAASDGDVEFLAEDDWPEVTHYALWAGSTYVASFPLTTPRQIGDGATLKFSAGEIKVGGLNLTTA